MLEVNGVSKSYESAQQGWFKANHQVIKQVTFSVKPGESVGLVGESGSGKSTLARLILGLERPDHGDILLNGLPVWQVQARKNLLSVVFQDYYNSLNPRQTVYNLLAEPLAIMSMDKVKIAERIDELLQQTGISSRYLNYYSQHLSGGLAQRVCIARAIANHPQFIVFDEAISSLDMPAQIEIIELLQDLKMQLNLTCLFISHDIQAISYFCDRVLFFEKGQIVEQSDIQQLVNVRSEYAKKLLASVINFQ